MRRYRKRRKTLVFFFNSYELNGNIYNIYREVYFMWKNTISLCSYNVNLDKRYCSKFKENSDANYCSSIFSYRFLFFTMNWRRIPYFFPWKCSFRFSNDGEEMMCIRGVKSGELTIFYFPSAWRFFIEFEMSCLIELWSVKEGSFDLNMSEGWK